MKISFKNRKLLLLASLLSLLSTTAGADTYYRWVDSSGKTVMSDQPPTAGTKFDTLSSGNHKATSQDQPIKPDTSSKRPADEQWHKPEAPMKTATVVKNPEICEYARKTIWTIEHSGRVKVQDEEGGEFRYIDEEEKAARRKEANKAIELHCP